MENNNNSFDIQIPHDRCTECGACLVSCRYMELSVKKAQEEVRRLRQGSPKVSLKKCISCYACDAFCPNDALPYERILSFWNERYREKGVPARAKYVLPGNHPNFRMYISYSQEEQELRRKWNTKDAPATTVLYPGCNMLCLPLYAQGEIFRQLPVWGNMEMCCGEMYFRIGAFDVVWETAKRLTAFFNDKRVKEMVFLCPACYNMFSHVLPRHFGAKFNFHKVFFTDWLTERMDRGLFPVVSPVKITAVVHDSCHGRILGRGFMDSQRTLYQRLGMSLAETEKNRENGLCCGIAAGVNRYSVKDIIYHSTRQLRILDKTEGDEIAAYCPGCYLMLTTTRLFRPAGKRIAPLIEHVRLALGETPERKYVSRAFSALRGLMVHSMPRYFSRERHWF